MWKGLAVSVILAVSAFVAPTIIGTLLWVSTGADSFLALAPLGTTLLYAAAATFGWALGQPNPLRALAVSLGCVIMLGLGVPFLFNTWLSSKLEGLAASDAALHNEAPSPQIIALLQRKAIRGERETETDCALLCQRLLYTGGRKAVLAGAIPQTGQPDDAVGLVRYWIETKPTCPTTEVPKAAVLYGERYEFGRDRTSDYIEQQIAKGRCLMSGPSDIAEADTAALDIPFHSGSQAQYRVGGGIDTAGAALFQRISSQWTLVSRARVSITTKMKSPLRFAAGGFDNTIDGEEVRQFSKGSLIERELGPWLGELP